MSKSLTVEEAKRKLEHYCSYRERCHKEVFSKLREVNMTPTSAEVIVSHLIQEDYLNETRFSQSYARGKFRIKKWGKQRIVRELKLRNISEWNIKTALKEIDPESYDKSCFELVGKLWKAHEKKAPLARKKKVIDAMRYRGWEMDKVYEALRNLEG